ncbi:MAG TPA: hypothetical protein VFF30_18400 [Nitrososphaerales archaeon]|nr:hypothetical protein [Nitrososphaerales archaeon]
MSDNKNEKKENLNDLKEKLWKKILGLDARLQIEDDKSDEYRKTLDAYHKIVKSYLDIIKVQHYAPGRLLGDTDDDDIKEITALFNKVRSRENLGTSDKKTLQEFKEFIEFVIEEDPQNSVVGPSVSTPESASDENVA